MHLSRPCLEAIVRPALLAALLAGLLAIAIRPAAADEAWHAQWIGVPVTEGVTAKPANVYLCPEVFHAESEASGGDRADSSRFAVLAVGERQAGRLGRRAEARPHAR